MKSKGDWSCEALSPPVTGSTLRGGEGRGGNQVYTIQLEMDK